MTGPNKQKWLTASDEEVQRLMASGTIRPIFAADQPSHRRKDTTYYAPKPKEKLDQQGNIVYRMRGTLGGDKVNYDGVDAARKPLRPTQEVKFIGAQLHFRTFCFGALCFGAQW